MGRDKYDVSNAKKYDPDEKLRELYSKQDTESLALEKKHVAVGKNRYGMFLPTDQDMEMIRMRAQHRKEMDEYKKFEKERKKLESMRVHREK